MNKTFRDMILEQPINLAFYVLICEMTGVNFYEYEIIILSDTTHIVRTITSSGVKRNPDEWREYPNNDEYMDQIDKSYTWNIEVFMPTSIDFIPVTVHISGAAPCSCNWDEVKRSGCKCGAIEPYKGGL